MAEKTTDKVEEVVKATKETPKVEVTQTTTSKKPKVEVVSAAKPDEKNKPEENVRIRLRKDYSCCIAMQYYDFKEGKCYNVPRNVKRILNKAGLLSPL